MMVAGGHAEAIQCTLYGGARIKATEPAHQPALIIKPSLLARAALIDDRLTNLMPL